MNEDQHERFRGHHNRTNSTTGYFPGWRTP